jgi:hypothetical protein
MIRHYDMTTGEEVGKEIRGGSAQSVQQAAETILPRLMTVHEATSLQAGKSHLPADMATLPVETILATWS